MICSRSHAQRFGCDLGQHGVGAGAQVGRADEQVEAAVVVELDAGRAHVQTGDAGAVHADGHAEAAPDVGSRRVDCAMPGRLRAPSRWPRRPPPCRHPGRCCASICAKPSRPSPMALRQRQLLAFLHPVQPLERDGVHAERLGQFLHVLLQAEERLRRAVAAEGAGHRLVGVDHVAVEAGIGQPVGAQPAEAGHHLHGQSVRAVCAGVGHDAQIRADQLAVFVHAAAEAQASAGGACGRW